MEEERRIVEVEFAGDVYDAVIRPSLDGLVHVDIHDDADPFLSFSMPEGETGEGVERRLSTILYAYHQGHEDGESWGRSRVQHELRKTLGI